MKPLFYHSTLKLNFLMIRVFITENLSNFLKSNMRHDQGERVGCREYWVTGLKRWQILMFFIVFKLWRMFISPQLDLRLRWGLDQNVAFLMDKWLMLKTQNWILPTCDSFPLIMSHIYIAWQFRYYTLITFFLTSVSFNSIQSLFQYQYTRYI